MIHLSESSAMARNSPKELLNKGCSFPVPKRLLSITSSLLYKLKSLLKYWLNSLLNSSSLPSFIWKDVALGSREVVFFNVSKMSG